jgi:uncharacterized membrane-anchored protein YitT (DUF2179 family)
VSALRRVDPRRLILHRPVRDYIWMTIGVALAAFALDSFLIPNRLAAGGVSGLATVIYFTVKDATGIVIPVGVQMLIMNAILLAIALRVRGWRYLAKTVYGAVALSVLIDLFAMFVPHLAPKDPLLAVLYGGAISGLGLGLVFKAGGNTGGTDIIAQLLTRRFSLGVGQLLIISDAFVMGLAALKFGPTLALYGFVAVFVSSVVVDTVQEGLSTEKVAYIVSEDGKALADAILKRLGRGATVLTGTGLYGAERDVVLSVVSRRELDSLKSLVHTLDPGAFLFISDVHETLGKGFKQMGRA